MEVPKELEITEAQRQQGLENPLTPEQVKWVNQAMISEMAGVMLKWENPQAIAQKLLPQGKSLNDIYQALEIF
ncbi:hypothetical protein FACS1894184_16950 [Clostridia bacterium]|nr:hypothetical protein FACS1894184_16950 [Clostridia bacterium]